MHKHAVQKLTKLGLRKLLFPKVTKMGSMISGWWYGHRKDYNGVGGFWEASGHTQHKLAKVTPPPPPEPGISLVSVTREKYNFNVAKNRINFGRTRIHRELLYSISCKTVHATESGNGGTPLCHWLSLICYRFRGNKTLERFLTISNAIFIRHHLHARLQWIAKETKQVVYYRYS